MPWNDLISMFPNWVRDIFKSFPSFIQNVFKCPPGPSVYFATSDSSSHQWVASQLQPQVDTSEARAVLLEKIVPERPLAPQIRRGLDSANVLNIVERADEKRFVTRNPVGGYDLLCQEFDKGGSGDKKCGGQLRRIEMLLINGTCHGWRSALFATGGWAVTCEGLGARQRVFKEFVSHLVCRQGSFPAGTVIHDVPAASAQDLPLADAQGLVSYLASRPRTSYATC